MNAYKVTFAIVMTMFLAVAVTAQQGSERLAPQQRMQGMMGGRGGMMGYNGMMGNMMGSGMMNGGMMYGMMGNMMSSGKMGTPNLYLQFEEELGLSDNQVESLKNIRLDFAKNTADNRSKLQVDTLELQDLLEMDSVNMRNVESKINEIHKLQASNQLAAVRAGIDAKNVLTPDQRTKVKSLIDQHAMFGPSQNYGNAHGHSGGMMH